MTNIYWGNNNKDKMVKTLVLVFLLLHKTRPPTCLPSGRLLSMSVYSYKLFFFDPKSFLRKLFLFYTLLNYS